MSNYTKTTNFGAKDTLPPGDSQKIIRGTEFDTEFNNIATAVATKLEVDGSNNLVLAGTASATKFIPTGGTASGNGLYLPTANTLALSTNGVERVRLDSSGNLLVGTATGFTTTGAAGGVAVTGHGIYPYTTYSASSPSGLVNTINTVSTVFAPSASFSGATSSGYYGLMSLPSVSATGAGGTGGTFLYSLYASPQLSSSGASGRVTLGGIYISSVRASSSDASSNASNAVVGVFSAAGIEGTVSSGASATEIIGFTSTAYSGSGTSTQVYGYRSSVEATSVGTDQNTTITNVAAYAVSRIRLGLTSGATSTVTNLYGVNIMGVDVRATATVTNYYAFYADAPTVTGTLTNRWGVYIADASSPNYFAGSVQVGAGTAAAPTLTTIADTNTGVYFPAADVVGVSTNGTERARVKSTGQLRFVPLSADPAGAESGDVYYNSTSNKLKVYNGTAWVDLH